MYRIRALSCKAEYYFGRNLTELTRDARNDLLVESRQVRSVAQRLENAKLLLDKDFEVVS